MIIASTPNMHYEQARYALERGLHVLMEKPFVLKAEHANDLERLARRKGLILSVCHPWLYHPSMDEAREFIRQGKLGRILIISASFAQRVYDLYCGEVPPRPAGVPTPNPSSYSDPAIVGGGEGHTQASHIIGTVLWLTQLQPTSVFAYMNNLDLAVDVVDAMVVRFAGGALATIATNGLLPAGVSNRNVQIQGDKGLLGMDSAGGVVYTFNDAQQGPVKSDPTRHGRVDSLGAVPRNFVRAILGEEPPHVEMEVALNEARILDAAYRSAASGQEEKIIA